MKKLSRFLAALLVLTLFVTIVPINVAFASQKVSITSECNLRSGPGLGYSIKRSLSAGKTCTYLDSKKKDSRGVTWYKVKYDGKKGWVSGRCSKLVSSSSKKVKTTGSVHIRSSASRSGSIIGTVGSGVKLSYRGKTSKDSRGVKWYAVTYNGKKGWVSSVYSKLV